MKRLPISVCVISGAEAHRIERALASVAGWTSEIIVVLNMDVQDGTEEIARKHGAKVFREPWKGHIAQKNSAADKATQPWRLGLDADEEVSPALRNEISQLFALGRASHCAAWSVPRCTFHCGRWIRHGDWYPDRKTRLWQQGLAQWTGLDPHDRLEVRGTVGRLRADLLHYSFDSIDHQLSKIGPYADPFVQHARMTGRSAAWTDLVIRPMWRFIRGYLIRLGFLDGWPGYYIAWATAFGTLTRYAKLREASVKEAQPLQSGEQAVPHSPP